MTLTEFFNKSTIHAERLVAFYDELDFHEKKTRSEWRNKLFSKGTRIVDWGKKAGVWRAIDLNNSIQILGRQANKAFLEDLLDRRPMLLQFALVMMLAAIDKMLHQAIISKNFVQLLRSGRLDNLAKNFPPSEAYGIAMESRIRRGPGGRQKPRPANKIKELVSARLYELSFLSTRYLEEVCAVNGADSIFTKYATHVNRKGAEPLRKQWSLIYKKRNTIVHECGITRTKISPKKIRFDVFTAAELKKDIDFSKRFGKFLANELG